ncbi:MAG: hypothetical protein HY791_32450 [Deltaproteobacteria bacterium]|nr:hypothetical protein [Deltaproteobacteria bacterium]
MRSFFQALERRGVRYLLISGQASVIYGAAAFSEDVDLWVQPTAASVAGLVESLRDVAARIHKLTPALTVRNMRFGHGFHFRIPGRPLATYLDIMGRPPRVKSFEAASRRASKLETDWGVIPVVRIEELVELKKTRRMADYDVISRLVRIRLEQGRVTLRTLRWALDNSFRVEDVLAILSDDPRGRQIAARSRRAWVAKLASCKAPGAADLDRAQDQLALELAQIQRSDVKYWSPVIEELKEMRRSGALLIEGDFV